MSYDENLKTAHLVVGDILSRWGVLVFLTCIMFSSIETHMTTIYLLSETIKTKSHIFNSTTKALFPCIMTAISLCEDTDLNQPQRASTIAQEFIRERIQLMESTYLRDIPAVQLRTHFLISGPNADHPLQQPIDCLCDVSSNNMTQKISRILKIRQNQLLRALGPRLFPPTITALPYIKSFLSPIPAELLHRYYENHLVPSAGIAFCDILPPPPTMISLKNACDDALIELYGMGEIKLPNSEKTVSAWKNPLLFAAAAIVFGLEFELGGWGVGISDAVRQGNVFTSEDKPLESISHAMETILSPWTLPGLVKMLNRFNNIEQHVIQLILQLLRQCVVGLAERTLRTRGISAELGGFFLEECEKSQAWLQKENECLQMEIADLMSQKAAFNTENKKFQKIDQDLDIEMSEPQILEENSNIIEMQNIVAPSAVLPLKCGIEEDRNTRLEIKMSEEHMIVQILYGEEPQKDNNMIEDGVISEIKTENCATSTADTGVNEITIELNLSFPEKDNNMHSSFHKDEISDLMLTDESEEKEKLNKIELICINPTNIVVPSISNDVIEEKSQNNIIVANEKDILYPPDSHQSEPFLKCSPKQLPSTDMDVEMNDDTEKPLNVLDGLNAHPSIFLKGNHAVDELVMTVSPPVDPYPPILADEKQIEMSLERNIGVFQNEQVEYDIQSLNATVTDENNIDFSDKDTLIFPPTEVKSLLSSCKKEIKSDSHDVLCQSEDVITSIDTIPDATAVQIQEFVTESHVMLPTVNMDVVSHSSPDVIQINSNRINENENVQFSGQQIQQVNQVSNIMNPPGTPLAPDSDQEIVARKTRRRKVKNEPATDSVFATELGKEEQTEIAKVNCDKKNETKTGGMNDECLDDVDKLFSHSAGAQSNSFAHQNNTLIKAPQSKRGRKPKSKPNPILDIENGEDDVIETENKLKNDVVFESVNPPSTKRNRSRRELSPSIGWKQLDSMIDFTSKIKSSSKNKKSTSIKDNDPIEDTKTQQLQPNKILDSAEANYDKHDITFPIPDIENEFPNAPPPPSPLPLAKSKPKASSRRQKVATRSTTNEEDATSTSNSVPITTATNTTQDNLDEKDAKDESKILSSSVIKVTSKRSAKAKPKISLRERKKQEQKQIGIQEEMQDIDFIDKLFSQNDDEALPTQRRNKRRRPIHSSSSSSSSSSSASSTSSDDEIQVKSEPTINKSTAIPPSKKAKIEDIQPNPPTLKINEEKSNLPSVRLDSITLPPAAGGFISSSSRSLPLPPSPPSKLSCNPFCMLRTPVSSRVSPCITDVRINRDWVRRPHEPDGALRLPVCPIEHVPMPWLTKVERIAFRRAFSQVFRLQLINYLKEGKRIFSPQLDLLCAEFLGAIPISYPPEYLKLIDARFPDAVDNSILRNMLPPPEGHEDEKLTSVQLCVAFIGWHVIPLPVNENPRESHDCVIRQERWREMKIKRLHMQQQQQLLNRKQIVNSTAPQNEVSSQQQYKQPGANPVAGAAGNFKNFLYERLQLKKSENMMTGGR